MGKGQQGEKREKKWRKKNDREIVPYEFQLTF